MTKSRILSIALTACLGFCLCLSFPVVASNNVGTAESVVYDLGVEEDPILENATKLQEDVEIKNGRIITTTVYRLENGEIVKDVFERGDFSKERSTTGSDTVTRTRYLTHGSVSLTASFKWAAGKVECTNASGSYSIDSSHVKEYCTATRPTGSSTSSVSATLKYHFYDSTNPLHFVKSSFYVKCNTTGNITNNA